ncbi:hypothetical protein J2X21_000144 [Kinneretia asaccharophila]|uniref:Uncharacterized protein n=1 Tax=Roseateles asaccharophilus TaxID=582607 RepID=A0ABU2A3E4_9BURK|nr:hypothetical protein [Roseateles asaccharophilus]
MPPYLYNAPQRPGLLVRLIIATGRQAGPSA